MPIDLKRSITWRTWRSNSVSSMTSRSNESRKSMREGRRTRCRRVRTTWTQRVTLSRMAWLSMTKRMKRASSWFYVATTWAPCKDLCDRWVDSAVITMRRRAAASAYSNGIKGTSRSNKNTIAWKIARGSCTCQHLKMRPDRVTLAQQTRTKTVQSSQTNS